MSKMRTVALKFILPLDGIMVEFEKGGSIDSLWLEYVEHPTWPSLQRFIDSLGEILGEAVAADGIVDDMKEMLT